MFVLRGGGGAESRVCGRYSVAVDSFRGLICCILHLRHIGEDPGRYDRAVLLEALAANLKRW